ncbi:MAG: hypothetical protein JXA96_04770 [Sedimentisphaerales bacterium]|nr:hypothetical protein [Sedimentisphaerales bacterium]
MSNYSRNTSSQQAVVITIQAIIIIGLLVALAYLTGIVKAPSEQIKTYQITYRVSASGGQALVTYTQSDGTKSESQMVKTPWIKSFNFQTGDVVFLTAGNPAEGDSVSCQIIQDGVVKDEDNNTFEDKAACALRVY